MANARSNVCKVSDQSRSDMFDSNVAQKSNVRVGLSSKNSHSLHSKTLLDKDQMSNLNPLAKTFVCPERK